MRKPKVIICPAGCGYILIYRRQKRCVGCGVKLFYVGDIINPNDENDMNGFIYQKQMDQINNLVKTT